MKTKYYRKAHIIRTINEDGSFADEPCMTNGAPSINAAKRRSRELQNKAGGLGNGSLRVVEKFPLILREGMREVENV